MSSSIFVLASSSNRYKIIGYESTRLTYTYDKTDFRHLRSILVFASSCNGYETSL